MNDIAVSDAQIPGALAKLAPEFQFLYPGKPAHFQAWLQSLALCVIENKDLRLALGSDQGKRTFIRAVQRAVSTGLSLNPQDGESALVAFKDGTIEYWPMKNGIIKGVLETNMVDVVSSDTIFERDSFTLKKTAHGDDYDFVPALKERGKPTAYFAVVALKTGRTIVEYQPVDQVQAWKTKYGKGLDKPGSAWNKNFDGMAEKTVLKALLRGVHIAKSVDKILDLDDQANEIPEQGSANDRTEPAEKGTSADDVSAALESEPTGAEVVASVFNKPAETAPVKIGKAPPTAPAGDKIPDDLF